jgi:CheY-like chemotaxis protein
MANFKYDIAKLAKFDGFDAIGASKNFVSRQVYFDKLTEFAENSKLYLCGFTPSVVIYSQEDREVFLYELDVMQRKLFALGAIFLAAELKNLSDAVYKNDPGILSDRLMKFRADMDIITRHIISARISKDEKPLILAVDDCPTMLATIDALLKNDCTVLPASSGEAALKILEEHSPELFLLDIEMPDMNGYDLIKKIRAQERFKNTPILFVTGQSSREAVASARLHGVNGYILKPLDKTLSDKINAYLTV